ncbi:VQ motif-containing protein 20-like [Gastrolobium bilobum]|uniref:VQ motif-containing protein 20-like n=1 Tax=Gastrolobium bilobum TaxID=150636 RepID=UPI002AB2F3D4|nr:VQ motif-containing protein 20-like [Gastrolobium bilobum]
MSPAPFYPKKQITTNGKKINKDSHFIKKKSPSPSPPQASSTKPPQRQPVIIYTHSPKIIHTHPNNFMALVQKLTGLSRPDEDDDDDDQEEEEENHIGGNGCNPPKHEPREAVAVKEEKDCVKGEFAKKVAVVCKEENDTSSSVITDDSNCNWSCNMGEVKSCLVAAPPPMLDAPFIPYAKNLGMLGASSTDFLCSNKPLLAYVDALFF